MKNKIILMHERLYRMKCGVIESVNDILMTLYDVYHTRNRSPINAITHAYAGMATFWYFNKKPPIYTGKSGRINP